MVVEGESGFDFQFFHYRETGAVGKRPGFVAIVAPENFGGQSESVLANPFDLNHWIVFTFSKQVFQKV